MSNKTIFIDGLALVDGHFSGIGQYVLGMLKGLDNHLEKERLSGQITPRVKVIIPFDERKKFKKLKFKNIDSKLFPLPFRYMAALWHRGKMPPIDLWCGKGHYIFTRFVSMPLAFSSYSVVIYDLSFELHKEYSDDGNAKFLSKGTRKSVNGASKVFTISKNSKREIEDIYKVPSKDIVVAYPAADQRYFYKRSDKEISKIKDKYGIEGDYIIALSNLEPRKNLDTLIDAYCALPSDYRNKYSLLLVGVNGWKTDELFNKITKKVEDGYKIIRPSKYVSDADKPAIISGSKVLVYPSHYEGFGMPPLEAMACGIPVITADNSSLPEVVGNTGIMLDHKDVSGFTNAIKDCLDSQEKISKSMLTEGPKKASEFSWEKTANIYLEEIGRIK